MIKCATLTLNPEVRDDSVDRCEQIVIDVSIIHKNYVLIGTALGDIAS